MTDNPINSPDWWRDPVFRPHASVAAAKQYVVTCDMARHPLLYREGPSAGDHSDTQQLHTINRGREFLIDYNVDVIEVTLSTKMAESP